MVTAAEIMRYTSTTNPDLAWTDQDTADFTNNLINPVIETFNHFNDRFMNQHLYPLLGSLSGYIFTGNLDRYREGVEWFTVNKTAVDQGQNGAIKALFRLVDTNIVTGEPVDPPVVQHVEMGRDQAHGAGDITNVEIIARLLLAQGTKVDPVEGTVSTAADAVGPYEFLDNRILKAADFFARFMLGYDTPWIPVAAHTDALGNPTIIYKALAGGYRGRIGGNVYDLYYYYKYTAGLNMEEAAPYFDEMFAKRHMFYWESPDGGADYWLYIPQEAEAEGGQHLPRPVNHPDLKEVEDRYTSLDGHSVTVQEGDTSFVRLTATEEGSRIALVASSTGEKTLGFRIRTNGTAKLAISGIDTLTLPDTKGQWKYVTYTMNDFQGFGDLVYFTASGSGTIVDFDHVNVQAGAQLTPPVFNAGKEPLKLFAYVGSSAVVRFDFSATDAGATDIVTYQMDHKPEGADFDESTGAFAWTPTAAGTYSIVVGASDGASVATRDVEINVSEDRHSAVEAAIASYQADTIYVQSTLDLYQSAYDDIMHQISSSSDDLFYEQLMALSLAVDGLREVTPLLPDGSMNYRDMFASSTMGTELPRAMDGAADSFVGYYLAQDRAHIMDFGPGFRVSADAFELQVRVSFPERIGGVTMFGSNDKENWTRLTPGLTIVSEDRQRLDVQDDLRNEKFRFLKMQMIDPPPVTVGLEISEFRIYGLRHEVINKLESVSIGSDQGLAHRIVIGDTVQLSFTTTEPIRDVSVKIEDQEVIARSNDQLHWSAQWVANEQAAPGRVKFSINYKTTNGQDGTETIFTTDHSVLYLADETDLIRNVLDMADLQDSSGRNPTDLRNTAAALFDGNPGSITDFRVNGSGYGGYMTFDFKVGSQVRLTSVELLARQDNYASRLSGAVAQGSNDNTTWKTISTTASGSPDWQTLSITDNAPYRYIRIYNGNNWFGNMSELRLHGHITVSVEEVLADAESLPASAYTKGSYYLYRQELSRIRAEMAAPGYNEAQILDEIAKAKKLLVLVGVLGGGTDKTLLAIGLDEAEAAMAEGIYSAVSIQVLQQAIDAASSAMGDADASQADVDGAYDDLHAAIEALQYMSGMPVLEGLKDVAVNAEQKLTIIVEAVNAVEDVAFGVSGDLPEGASFDAAAHAFAWTPSIDQGGRYEVTFTAAAGGLSSSKTITITVIGQPAFDAPAGTIDVTAEQLFTYPLTASDPTGRSLKYSASGLPVGAKIDADSGLFTWTANPSDYGVHPVIFTVSNGTFAVSRTVAFKVGLNILPAEDYTRASYYPYFKEANRIASELENPEADKARLLAELRQAEDGLVPVSTLPAERIPVTSPMVSASSVSWDGKANAALNGWRAVDGNTGTFTDTKTNPGWVLIELGAGNEQAIGSIKFYPRSNYQDRMNGAIVQGSLDGASFTDLHTISGITRNDWASATISDPTAYRYLRFYSPNGNANVAELAFYKKPLDKTLLQVLLDEAAAIDEELYDEASVQALHAEVSQAQLDSDHASATQAEIDAASDRLLAALEGMQWRDISAMIEPSVPNGNNGWYTSPVKVTLSPAAFAEYSLDGGNAWTAYDSEVVLGEEGIHQLLYRRSTDPGKTGSLTINMDLTAPAVRIMGEASYAIDQMVTITCSATDVTSSVYGAPCNQPLLQVQAYTLDAGEHTVSVTAVDRAGHRTTAEHTFTVTATFDGLKAVTNAFLQETGHQAWDSVRKGYMKKLDQAKEKADGGKTEAARGIMGGWISEIRAHAGKFFTQEQADTLIRWAQTLL